MHGCVLRFAACSNRRSKLVVTSRNDPFRLRANCSSSAACVPVAPLRLSELRLECMSKRLADGEALSGDPSLQQIQYSVVLTAVVGRFLDGGERCADALVEQIHHSLESRQPSRIGNSGAAEEHHAALVVRLHECVGNVRSVGDELHSLPPSEQPLQCRG